MAFLDANIVLEGKPMKDLPWEEIASDGVILALIVPKAMEEIDAKKRDGRLGPVARSFNHLIAPSVLQRKPVVVREADPRVELAMAVCDRIPWDDYDELDPDDGDSRIVAEALNARGMISYRRLLISHDIKPLVYATGRDLPVHQASDAWLRPIEPGPKDKEIQRLKQQLGEFRKDEPVFEIEIEIADARPWSIQKFAPLTDAQRGSVTKQILRKNERVAQRRDVYSGPTSFLDYDSEYDDRYDTYRHQTVPEFVERFAQRMELLANQRTLTISVRNKGQIRADHLVIEITTNDGWLNDKVIAVSPLGPNPPKLRGMFQTSFAGINALSSRRVGRHEFDFTTEAKQSPQCVATCEDFRNGQEFEFAGVVVPATLAGSLEITVKITAANLRGAVTKSISFDKSIVESEVATLVDLDALNLKGDFSVKAAILEAIDTRRHDDIQWDLPSEDDDD